MVKPSQTKKDLATPTTADRTMEERMKKRQLRDAGSLQVVMTAPMLAMKQREVPEATNKKARYMWHRVRSLRTISEDMSDVVCGLCWEVDSHFCPCGCMQVEGCDQRALVNVFRDRGITLVAY